MTRIRARVAIIALIAVHSGSRGGVRRRRSSSGSEDPNQVLKETFSNPTKISSGNLDIDLSGSAEGTQSGSLTATIDGPFQSDKTNPTRSPSSI